MVLILFLLSALIGYIIFVFFNDPMSNLNGKKRRLPSIRYRNIEFLPYFRIHIRTKTYHVHHWLILTIVTAVTFVSYEGLQHMILLKGAAFGGIIQGLRYPDRFRFRHPRNKPHRLHQ